MIPLNLSLLSFCRRYRKTISWLLLVLFTAVGCVIFTPRKGMTATVEPLEQQKVSTLPSKDRVSPPQPPNSEGSHAEVSLAVEDLVVRGKGLYAQQNYSAAIKTLQQALAVYEAEGDELRQGMVLSNIALAYQQLTHWREVANYVEQSLAKLENLAPTEESKLILAQALDIKGRLQLAQGNGELAARTWEKAGKTYQEIGEETGVIRTGINQAQALQSSGYYRRSLKVLNQLEATLQEQPDSVTKAVGLRSLGNALLLVGDGERAREALENSLEIANKLESRKNISAALFSLGNLARSQQDFESAIAFYQNSTITSTDPVRVIRALLNQVTIYREKNNWSSIPSLLGQIEPLLADLASTHDGIYARINYAQNLIKLQEESLPPQPPNTGGRKVKIESPILVPSPSRRGLGDITKAKQTLKIALRQAKQLDDRPATAYTLLSLGKLYEQSNRLSAAQKVTRQALVIAQEIDSRDIAYQAQWQLGRVLKAQGEEQNAISYYRQAVNNLQSLRSDLVAINPEIQFTFRESIEPIYREYVDLLLLKSENVPEANLIAAREAMDSLQLAELENFFRATCLDTQPVVLDQITDKDDPNAAIIYPIVLPDRFEIIVKLPQQQLRHYTTIVENPQRRDRIIQRLEQTLSRVNSRETIPLAQQVYRWLIRPMARDLASSNVKTLVFVLDSSLRGIPMSLLHDGQQYLIEKYAVALAPGLQLVQPQPIAQKQLKALTAGLTEARDGFPPLQYVANELNTIQSEIAETDVLLNSEFVSSNLQSKINATDFPIVHLATHGQFSSQADNTFILAWDDRININQLRSLLQNSDRDREIELLVLSACETLSGDKRAALGLAGVAVRAGARSTLGSLWKVNDEATSLLMSNFYQELSRQDFTKVEALRQAQLSLLKNPRFDSPFYWASFVLLGNWL